MELADVGSWDLARLELDAVRALWAPTRTFRAKEVLWAVLAPGHRVSPVWRTQYSRVLWLARQAQTPGAGQGLVQTIMEETDCPPVTAPVGRALQAVWQLRWEAVRGWWVWRQPETLHLVLEDWGSLCHRLRESQWYTALLALERRYPTIFGGMEAEVCRPTCAQGMTVASSDGALTAMRQLKAHYRELWTRRLARPGAGRQDMFLLDFFPPAGPGLQQLRPFQRLPRRQVQRNRHGAAEGGAGRVAAPPRVAVCAKHPAPPCAACTQRGAEHYCRRAHEGHRMDAA